MARPKKETNEEVTVNKKTVSTTPKRAVKRKAPAATKKNTPADTEAVNTGIDELLDMLENKLKTARKHTSREESEVPKVTNKVFDLAGGAEATKDFLKKIFDPSYTAFAGTMLEGLPSTSWNMEDFKVQRTIQAIADSATPFKDAHIPHLFLAIPTKQDPHVGIAGVFRGGHKAAESMALSALADIAKGLHIDAVRAFIIASAATINAYLEALSSDNNTGGH